MTEPTDAELKALWQLHAADIGGIFHYARAALAKWGQPAVVGEPDFYTACAWYEGGGVGEWIALPGYSNETEHGVKHLVLEAARNEGYKGAAAGRLLELGWEIRPVFLTQPPTQAQAAESVPAVDEVAERYRNAIASACEGWTMPDGLRKHLETALWIQPTPQPTQPQAGAVPLDEARRLFDAGWKAAALFCEREDVAADGIIGFGACPQFEAAFSAAHGSKGGQHGTE